MPLEGLNIFSVGGFTFFLLIVSIGYFVIEIVFYKFDFVRAVFRRYNNNIFDRIIMYILVGIATNILFYFFLYFSNSIIPFVDFFNLVGKIGFLKNSYGKDVANNVQIISTSILYYITLLTYLIVIGGLLHEIRWIYYMKNKKTKIKFIYIKIIKSLTKILCP